MSTGSAYSAEKRILVALAIGVFTALQAWSQASTNWYEKSMLAFAAGDRTNPPPAGAILLVGDSLFRKWKTAQEDLSGYKIINRVVFGLVIRRGRWAHLRFVASASRYR